MKNQGISLISLIITIIVIIILAAIVIFSGMDTPERAQLANFGQQVSNVDAAIVDQISGVTTTFATEGKTRNQEQIYYTLATGEDCGQYGKMKGDDLITEKNESGEPIEDVKESQNCQNIVVEYAARKTNDKKGGLGITLPTVREHNEAWYVTSEGKVFNATGFVSGGKTYWTADLYTEGELKVDAKDGTYEKRAVEIAKALNDGKTGAITVGEYSSDTSAE